MSSLRHCLKKMGLAEHEAAILRGAVDGLKAEGYEAQKAAETAVRDYISSLEQERADILRQVGEKAPATPQAVEQPKAPDTNINARHSIPLDSITTPSGAIKADARMVVIDKPETDAGAEMFDLSGLTEGQKVAGDVLRELGLLRGRMIDSEVPHTRIGTMMRRWDAKKIDDARMLDAVREELARRELLKDRDTAARTRGADWLRERLIRARRTGELSSRETDLALWLIDKNPGIAEDLGISIKAGDKDSANGSYNKLARIVTIFSGRSNALTATHEILHHTERMMPPEVQAGIREEWVKQLREKVAEAKAKLDADAPPGSNTPESQRAAGQKVLLDWMLEAAEKGDSKLALTIWKGVPGNNLQRVLSYRYASPSEFWAVNGSELVRKRMLSEGAGWIEQAKQWLRELIEKVKSLFGYTSDAPVIRGLEAVLRGEGRFVTRDLISEGADTSSEDRTTGFPATVSEPLRAFRNDEPMKRHPDYRAAKAGDMEAAARLVDALVPESMLAAARERYTGATFVPVIAEEASGHNAIPHLLAARLAAEAQGETTDGIVQSSRAFHTGANAMERIVARPEFTGEVERGHRYVLVDDVTTMGNTLAELADYIQAHGGEVVGVAVLVDASRSGKLRPSAQQVRLIEQRLGDALRQDFGIDPRALTASEADYLVGFETPDALRDRAAKARRETEARLRARALRQEVDPGTFEDLSEREDPDLAFTDKARKEAEQRNWSNEQDRPNFSGEQAFREAAYYKLEKMLAGEQPKPLRTPSGRLDHKELGRRLNDYMRTQHQFKWWHRVISTDFHKAQIAPDTYGVVYYGVQDYISDINHFSLQAAEQAPLILPKMEDFGENVRVAGREIFRGKQHRADLAAASKALFEGTIEDRLYTPTELREKGLTDRQLSMYWQMRQAIDTSLDTLATSQIARIAKTTGLPVPDLRQLRPDDALTRMRQVYAEAQELSEDDDLSTKLDEALTAMEGVTEQIAKLKRDGYAPLMRFGEYAVQGKLDGEYFFLMFESERERNRAETKLRQMGATEVKTRILNSESFKLFRGMDPNALQLFAETADTADGVRLQDIPAFQEYLRLAINQRSAMKRLMRRDKVLGFQTDGRRMLAQFVVSNARLAAQNHHMMDLMQAVERINETTPQGDIAKEAGRLVNYVREPQDNAVSVKLRTAMFMHFLGGNLSSALVNLTQTPMMTAPYLGQFGNAKAAIEIARAVKDAKKRHSGRLGAAIERAILDQKLEPHEIHMLYAEADQTMTSHPTLRAAMNVWGSMFAAAEAFNRRIAFIAAFRMAESMTAKQLSDAGARTAYEFAVNAVDETQMVYNRGNRIALGRNQIAAPLLTFKQFTIGYLEFVSRLPTKQKVYALGMLVLLSGIQGFPFMDDLDDLIETLGQQLGYDTNAKKWKQDVLRAAIEPLAEAFGLDAGPAGKAGADFVMYGLSSLPFWPADIQGRLGMGNLIPGTGFFKKSQTNPEKQIAEFAGPLGSYALAVGDAARNLAGGDVYDAAKVGAPVAVQNGLKAIEMWTTGLYRDKRGGVVVEVDKVDAVLKSVGLQPRDVAAEGRDTRTEMESIKLQRVVEEGFAKRITDAVFFDRESDLEEAVVDLEAWNERNPATPVQITPQQIRARVKKMHQTRQERVIRSTPKELRGRVAEALEAE